MNETVKNVVVCLSCMALNDESDNFCQNCRAAIRAPSSLDPVQTIEDEGFMLRKAASGSPKFIVVFGTWLLFFPGLICIIALEMQLISHWDSFGSLVFFWIGAALFLVFVQLIFTVTKNYLKARDKFQNDRQTKQLLAEKRWRARETRKSRRKSRI